MMAVEQRHLVSSINLNILMDQLFRALHEECGIIFNDHTIRAMTITDSLLLLAESPGALQYLIDYTTAFFSESGMSLNNAKSPTIALFCDCRQTVVYTFATFNVNGQRMRSLGGKNHWTHLGIDFWTYDCNFDVSPH